MVGTTMLLPVYMPHSGYDEEDYNEALETVRDILTELVPLNSLLSATSTLNLGWTMSTMIFMGWTVSAGMGCTGLSVEEAVKIRSPTIKLRWLQLWNEVVTTMGRLQLHREKHLDEYLGSTKDISTASWARKDIRSTT